MVCVVTATLQLGTNAAESAVCNLAGKDKAVDSYEHGEDRKDARSDRSQVRQKHDEASEPNKQDDAADETINDDEIRPPFAFLFVIQLHGYCLRTRLSR